VALLCELHIHKEEDMDVRVLGSDDIGTLDKTKVKAALAAAFAGLKSGTSVQPTQTVTVFPDEAGDAIFYPGALWDLGLVGVKVSPYLASLAKAGKSPVTAYTLLLSVETGEPVLLCDSLALTTARTAATTSLALDYLIPESAKTLCVIGAGKVALAHLDYAAQQHAWSQIRVHSPSLATSDADGHAGRRDRLGALGLDVEVMDTAQAAVRDADVVLLCTSSGTPVVETEWLEGVKVVTSISTNVARAHEVAPESLQTFDVYCDYRATCPSTAGDMVLAAEHTQWSADQILGDLPSMVTGEVHPIYNGRPMYFRSTGLGIEDLAIASQV